MSLTQNTKLVLLCVSLFLSLFLSAPSVAAQQASPEMVVTGTRQPITWAQSGSDIAVITAQDIKDANYEFIYDAITDLAGVTGNRNGSFGGLANVRLRGASSNGHVLTLIDGIRMNDPTAPDSSFNFAYLDTHAVERIEVLKGAQSTFWGADAISGVVSVITKTPDDLSMSAFQEAGSHRSFRLGGSVADRRGRFAYRISASRSLADGISKADEADGNHEADGFRQSTIYGRFDFNVNDGLDLIANVNWSDSHYEYDVFTYSGETGALDGDADLVGDDSQLGTSLVARLTGDKIEQDIQLAFTRSKRKTHGSDNGFPEDATGDRYQARYQAAVTLHQAQKFGFGAEMEEVQQNYASGSTAKNDIHSLFAFYELSPRDSLTLSAGMRYDDHNYSGAETTMRFGFDWQMRDYIALHASAGEGFKPPNLFQTTFTCFGSCVPNPELKAELSDSWEFGFDFTSKTDILNIAATYFEQDIKNRIVFSFAKGYENIAYSKSEGVELRVAVALRPYLILTGNHTWLIKAEDGQGVKLGRLPKREGQVSLSYKSDKPVSGNVIWRYNGSEPDGFYPIMLGSWSRLDANLAWQFSERVAFYGQIENIFDEHYQAVLGYGEPGRAGRIGLRLRW